MAKQTEFNAPMASPGPTSGGQTITASGTTSPFHYSEQHGYRVAVMNFLELTYNGGVQYKHGNDAFGNPVLIEHENEQADFRKANTYNMAQQSGPKSISEMSSNRYMRRKRIAVYHNLARPLIDKVGAYLTRSKPRRNEAKKADWQRLRIDDWIEAMIEQGLKLTESWIGFDSAKLPDSVNTEAVAAQVDPKNQGKPYIVMADPRDVVDWDIDQSGEVTRVVIRYERKTKASFTDPGTTVIRYKEWTATDWTEYELVRTPMNENTTGKAADTGPTGPQVRLIETKAHAFGRCPWFRFKPQYPTEDLAELCRALFNKSSLLDEEHYNNTFTQKWVTGVKQESLKNVQFGSGNLLVFEQPDAATGTYGAIPGQAESLAAECERLRNAVYELVSMQHGGTKNVAESAEKKKRDLESLYTTLVEITKDIEKIDNGLTVGMDLAKADSENDLAQYSRSFDVASISELMENLEAISRQSFVPPDFRRSQAKVLMQKLEPFGDQAAYAEACDELIDISDTAVAAVTALSNAGMMTPEIAARVLGVPENETNEFVAGVEQHKAATTPNPADLVPPGEGDTGAPVDQTEGDGAEGEPAQPKPGAKPKPKSTGDA